jgi:hypothetical protein
MPATHTSILGIDLVSRDAIFVDHTVIDSLHEGVWTMLVGELKDHGVRSAYLVHQLWSPIM